MVGKRVGQTIVLGVLLVAATAALPTTAAQTQETDVEAIHRGPGEIHIDDCVEETRRAIKKILKSEGEE